MGFITLNRKVFDHFLWTEKRPLSRFEAWLDLIQLVSWKDGNELLIKGTLVTWNRGQYPISISFLAKRWMWGQFKVRLYLNLLKNEGQINTETTAIATIITLCKYDLYNPPQQGDQTENNNQTTGRQQGDNRETTGRQQELNKDNKGNKEKKIIKENILMSDLSGSDHRNEKVAYAFWQLFMNKLKELGINSTDLSKSKADPWVRAVRLMIDVDKRTEAEIREVFHYLKNEKEKNGFSWSRNIRSTEKLREQFEQVLAKARSTNKNGIIPDSYKQRIIQEANAQ